MADSTLSALPAASALSGSELLYGVQSAADVKITAAQMKTLALAAPLTITGVANTSVLTSTGYSLTGANAQNMVDLAGTWNTSGNPVALKIGITNTASGATSKFASFLAGAGGVTEVFNINKNGNINVIATATTLNCSFSDASNASFTAGFIVGGAAQTMIYCTNGTIGQYSIFMDWAGIGMKSDLPIGWSSSLTTPPNQGGSFDTLLTRKAAANIRMGAADAAAPVAQTLSVQSVVAGTSNTAGADWNITGSLSTGSGIAGKIVFNLSQIVAAATTQNASSSVLSLNTIAASGIQFPRYGAGALSTDASGNITATSDERLKHVTGHFKAGLAELMKIDPIMFRWSEDSGMETAHEYVGFGAHNVQESMPEAVGQTPDGYLTLSDRALLAACVNAIKDLSERMHK